MLIWKFQFNGIHPVIIEKLKVWIETDYWFLLFNQDKMWIIILLFEH